MIGASERKDSIVPAVHSPLCVPKAVISNATKAADTLLRRAVLGRLIADPLVSTGHIGVVHRRPGDPLGLRHQQCTKGSRQRRHPPRQRRGTRGG